MKYQWSLRGTVGRLAGGVLLVVALVGCSQQRAAVPNLVASRDSSVDSDAAWKKRYARYSVIVKGGMTKDQVFHALGKPEEEHNVIGNAGYEYWLYTLDTQIQFQVVFDKKGRVSATRIYS